MSPVVVLRVINGALLKVLNPSLKVVLRLNQRLIGLVTVLVDNLV